MRPSFLALALGIISIFTSAAPLPTVLSNVTTEGSNPVAPTFEKPGALSMSIYGFRSVREFGTPGGPIPLVGRDDTST
ncbi:hypothetical protein EVG20_g7771 [Dentipellis fragilis]|uniref:Uncharacterized protein n=1 Tax=Dentipellis fragilis TaxID=205917 RepID=A0A4Y9YAB5_9AGAM|nr:hypothetical protein EVG20_g7771 [Dentipellis fragilis]